MIDSDKRDNRAREWIEWRLCTGLEPLGREIFSMINKVEEIRISREYVGGSILEAIPNRTFQMIIN